MEICVIINWISKKYIRELNKNGSTLACLYAGWGKTFLAIWLITQISKTLIIVIQKIY